MQPPSLEIRVLGNSGVWCNQHLVHWRSEAAKHLLFYLLAYPKGRRREQILNDLWQCETNPHQSNRFRVTLHRIKEALGGYAAIENLDGRYCVLPEVLASSDLHRFVQRVESAQQTTGSGRLAAFAQAASAYAGDFMPECAADWANTVREDLRQVYAQTLLEKALLHCDQLQCAMALESLTAALRLEPLVGENYVQKQMVCLATLNSKYAAINEYRRFLVFLKHEVGDTPLPETIQLAQLIKRGEKVCPNRQC